jgi:hypothetical protein
MKQTFEGWTVAAKIVDCIGGEEHTYFMGTHTNPYGNKYISLERCPSNIIVLKNLHETKEDAIAFWNTGMWDLCIDRKSISVLPVKIKIDIDVSCLGLDWNGM